MSNAESETMRLQRYLARAGVASRRKSEQIILEGRVTVNGEVVCELGSSVQVQLDRVAVDGVPVTLASASEIIMLNKPAGYITTMSDPQGRRCVSELVPTEEIPGLFPVGRLDADTTGLLLFTNDGELGHALLHPSFHAEKHYVAIVEGELTQAEIKALAEGVQLEDGPTAPAQVDLPARDDWAWLLTRKEAAALGKDWQAVGLTIHEGRKRQVKRMLAAVGHPVHALHRDSFDGLKLGDLARGKWRRLNDEERKQIER